MKKLIFSLLLLPAIGLSNGELDRNCTLTLEQIYGHFGVNDRNPDQTVRAPYQYRPQEIVEPDWKRIPGYKDVTAAEWRSASWQRKNSIKNLADLKRVLGEKLTDEMAADIAKDQQLFATMNMLLPPQMINTMNVEDLKNDPIRIYMIPMASERQPEFPSHPMASRDSLHEHEMWAVEGLTHRYPTKVLLELTSTCPQYCGHCTRYDLVGQNVPQVEKRPFSSMNQDRLEQILDYLRVTPTIRDVVVSGGDVANVPQTRLEAFVNQLLEIPNIRDIRLASKGMVGLPQHFLQPGVLDSMERLAKKAQQNGVRLALHTHANHGNSITPLVREAAWALRERGFADVRNQGVLLNGVNAERDALLDLVFRLNNNGITPYYFYMTDMIENSEHWRVPLSTAKDLQKDLMGMASGFGTPTIVCDVPIVGKCRMGQEVKYTPTDGISLWSRRYNIAGKEGVTDETSKLYPYFDPIHTLPPEGQDMWRQLIKKSGKPAGK